MVNSKNQEKFLNAIIMLLAESDENEISRLKQEALEAVKGMKNEGRINYSISIPGGKTMTPLKLIAFCDSQGIDSPFRINNLILQELEQLVREAERTNEKKLFFWNPSTKLSIISFDVEQSRIVYRPTSLVRAIHIERPTIQFAEIYHV